MTQTDHELQRFRELILHALKPDKRLWDEEGEIDQIQLIERALKYDEEIIGLLFGNEDLKEKFFVKVNEAYIFKANDFQFFLEENEIDNSFTSYKNAIGLTDGRKFIQDTNDVVLNFPYKDCVLEGGQSTEEGEDDCFEHKDGNFEQATVRRKEIFYNNVIAHDEIDRLLAPKAFMNWARYDKTGKQKLGEIKRRADGTIQENMIIKGNNLLALHSLKKQFEGKIKLIYIDPPYNTGKDAFKYNDKFARSTWLTFMKNRLEVAKDLLREDGVVFVQCDDNEQAYLKVLMDEVFGCEAFVQTICVKMSETSGPKMAHKSKRVAKIKEFLLFYSKGKTNNIINEYPVTFETTTQKVAKNYNYIISNKDENYSNWEYRTLTEKENTDETFILKNLDSIFSTAATKSSNIKFSKNFTLVDDSLFLKGREVIWLSKRFIKGKAFENLGDIWWDIRTTGIAKEGGVSLKNGKKPEELIHRIISMCTEETDIVLDFFIGSGTSSAVSHKMGRQYIGIEQMDYGENDARERLLGVIKGDKTGISNKVNWKGEGEFIYFELAKWNEAAKERIHACKDLKELSSLLDDLCNKYFLHYNVNIKKFRDEIIKEQDFESLPLGKQKEIFATMIDNNQLYVHHSEMEDTRFKISKDDQTLTHEFYSNG